MGRRPIAPNVMVRNDQSVRRRTVLRATGAAVAGASLAGCTGGASDSGGGTASESGGSTSEATESTAGEGTAASSDGSSDGDSGGGSSDFDGWLSDTGNFDGVVDATGEDEVTVRTGAEGNGGNYAFDPAAVRVSAGTTVVWQWTGEGAAHNVAAKDGGFESEMTAEEGFTFSHTFEESGTHKYVCTPHKAMGMKGVVVVE